MKKTKKKDAQKIVIVSSDDWRGIYINGELVSEDHSFSEKDMLRILDIEYESLEADDEWLAEYGNLPQKLSEVKLL